MFLFFLNSLKPILILGIREFYLGCSASCIWTFFKPLPCYFNYERNNDRGSYFHYLIVADTNMFFVEIDLVNILQLASSISVAILSSSTKAS